MTSTASQMVLNALLFFLGTLNALSCLLRIVQIDSTHKLSTFIPSTPLIRIWDDSINCTWDSRKLPCLDQSIPFRMKRRPGMTLLLYNNSSMCHICHFSQIITLKGWLRYDSEQRLSPYHYFTCYHDHVVFEE